MARPSASVMLAHYEATLVTEVLAADAIYAVFYDGKPINLRSEPTQVNGFKYPRTSFANSGHAFNLAARLNEKFKTTKFSVVALTVGVMLTQP